MNSVAVVVGTWKESTLRIFLVSNWHSRPGAVLEAKTPQLMEYISLVWRREININSCHLNRYKMQCKIFVHIVIAFGIVQSKTLQLYVNKFNTFYLHEKINVIIQSASIIKLNIKHRLQAILWVKRPISGVYLINLNFPRQLQDVG